MSIIKLSGPHPALSKGEGSDEPYANEVLSFGEDLGEALVSLVIYQMPFYHPNGCMPTVSIC